MNPHEHGLRGNLIPLTILAGLCLIDLLWGRLVAQLFEHHVPASWHLDGAWMTGGIVSGRVACWLVACAVSVQHGN